MKAAKGNQWPLAGNRGMALLVTILVVSLLTAVTVQFARTIRDDFFASENLIDGEQLRVAAFSGVNVGSYLLQADGRDKTFDTLQDPWASLDADSFKGLFNRGTLQLTITDLSGRLQVNSLVPSKDNGKVLVSEKIASENREILKRLLLSGTFDIKDEEQAQRLVDALVDWLDPDDRESDFGAESSYYQTLDPPYGCRNGPIPVIEELLLVRGFTPKLLFGDSKRPGLAEYLTVYGRDGKININTAPIQVLRALSPQMTEDLALEMNDYRRDKQNVENLAQPGWYQKMVAWPGDVTLPRDIMVTRSSYFKLDSQGVFHDQRRRVTAVVERDKKNEVTVIYRRVE